MLKVNNPRMLKINGIFADFETTEFELEIHRVTVNFQITVNLFKISVPIFNVCVSKISGFIPKNSKQNTEQNRTRKFGFATEQNRTRTKNLSQNAEQNRTRKIMCSFTPVRDRKPNIAT